MSSTQKQFFVWGGSFEKYGCGYGNDTIVKLSPEFRNKMKEEQGVDIWPYARHKETLYNGKKYYHMFWVAKIYDNCKDECPVSWNKCAGYFCIDDWDIEEAISEIVEAKKVPIKKQEMKKDIESEEVMIGWVVYILLLLVSLIFTQWYVGWIGATVFFMGWRRIHLWEV